MREQLVKCADVGTFQLGKPLDVEGFWARVRIAQMSRIRDIWSWRHLMPRFEKRHDVAFGGLAGGVV